MIPVTPQEETRAGLAAKAVAICAVVLLHVLALFPETLYTTQEQRELFVIVNQGLRFCVPLFIALSGYGLSKKYFNPRLEPVQFLWRRMAKLLPLYLLWSGVIFLSLGVIGAWRPLLDRTWWEHLVLGSVDYHLYFVLLIFQCYALFAFLPKLGRSGVRWLLLVSGLAQILWFGLLREFNLEPTSFTFLDSMPETFLQDQFQYRLLINWLFYFLLGVELAGLELQKVRVSWLWLVGTGAATIGGLWWMIADTTRLIQLVGVTTYPTSFTRLPVMIFATGVIVAVILYAPLLTRLSLGRHRQFLAPRVIKLVGVHSYIIFLSHTVGLRIIAEFLHAHSGGGFHFAGVLGSTALLAIGLALSKVGLR